MRRPRLAPAEERLTPLRLTFTMIVLATACVALGAAALARAEADVTPPAIDVTLACDLPGDADYCRGNATVGASASDAESGVAALSCTLASAPVDCAGVLVTTQGSTTFVATAVDAAGNSATSSRDVRVDSVAPTLAISPQCGQVGANGWCLVYARVSRSASDSTSFLREAACELDGAPVNCGLFLPEGVHVVRVVQGDYAGNFAEASTIVKLERLGYSGFVGANCGPGHGAYCSGSTWNFTWALSTPVSGNASGYPRCTLDGASVACATSLTSAAGEGLHAWTFYETSNAGSSFSSSFSVGFDHVAPVPALTVSCPTASFGIWCSSPSATYAGSTTDAASGVYAQACAVDAPVALFNLIYHCGGAVTGDGTHVVRMASEDKAGNRASTERLVGIDTQPPAVFVRPGCDFDAGVNGWCRGTARAAVSVSDAASGIATLSCTIDGYGVGCDSPSIWGQGEHVLNVTAGDFLGHFTTRLATLRMDTLAPSSTWTLDGVAGEGGWFVTPATINVSCSDYSPGSGCNGTLVSTGGPFSYAGTSIPFRDGSWNVTFAAVDRAGNAESAKHAAFRVDATPPRVTLRANAMPGLNGWWRSAATVNATCFDATSGVATGSLDMWIDAGIPAATSSVRVEREGSSVVHARCRDLAGNVGEAQILVRIDTVAPTGDVASTRLAVGPFVVDWSSADATSGVGTLIVLEDSDLGTLDGGREICRAEPAGNVTFASGDCRVDKAGLLCYAVTVLDQAGNAFSQDLVSPLGDATTFAEGFGHRCTLARHDPLAEAPVDVAVDARQPGMTLALVPSRRAA